MTPQSKWTIREQLFTQRIEEILYTPAFLAKINGTNVVELLPYLNYLAISKIEKGDTGPQGEQGIRGENGATWLYGADVPSNDLGVNGDLYLNQSTWNVYVKIVGTWSVYLNIQGATGSVGATGAQGEQGVPGITKTLILTDTIVNLSLTAVSTRHLSLSGGNAGLTLANSATPLPTGTIIEIGFNVISNTGIAPSSTTISLMKNGSAVSSVVVATGLTGAFSFSSMPIASLSTDVWAYRIVTASALSGAITISPICMTYTI